MGTQLSKDASIEIRILPRGLFRMGSDFTLCVEVQNKSNVPIPASSILSLLGSNQYNFEQSADMKTAVQPNAWSAPITLPVKCRPTASEDTLPSELKFTITVENVATNALLQHPVKETVFTIKPKPMSFHMFTGLLSSSREDQGLFTVLLVGGQTLGKSTAIQSMISTILGRVEKFMVAGQPTIVSADYNANTYKTRRTGNDDADWWCPLNFRDTRGFNPLDAELKSMPFEDQHSKSEVHCVMGFAPHEMFGSESGEMRTDDKRAPAYTKIVGRIRRLGHSPIVVIAKIDEFDPEMRTTLDGPTKKVEQLLKYASQTLAVPLNMVTYLVNYTREHEPTFVIDRQNYRVALQALQCCRQYSASKGISSFRAPKS